MIIEGIATNIQDVHDLNRFGADRIELCGEMEKDGLTPEMSLVKEAVEVSSIPVNVMIRPHDLSFHYTDRQIIQMEDQIREVGKLWCKWHRHRGTGRRWTYRHHERIQIQYIQRKHHP